MKGKFTQVECCDYLQRCQSQEEAIEVLFAYSFVKYARGSTTPQVFRKLQLLVCYLRVHRLHRIIARFPQAFLITQYHIEQLHGAALGTCPTVSKISDEVWALANRACCRSPRSGFNELQLTQSAIA